MRFTSELLPLALCLTPSLALPAVHERFGARVQKTTTTPGGQIIDWVPRGSQGQIAKAPPIPERKSNITQPNLKAIVDNHPGLQGPKGTVPIARPSKKAKAPKRLPHRKGESEVTARDGNAGAHWYASTAQAVDNFGGSAVLSMFAPYCQFGGDFSLLQTAVIRYDVPVSDGTTTQQTVEAGWINYPDQVANTHLFAFYTTNGYSANGDNIGGWNQDQAGWVQVDSEVFPGFEFTTISTDGGDQYEMDIQYQLRDGNWWLWVIDRWIGYFPASLFTVDVDPAGTLESHSSQINWYGEIYNSGTDVTTTDMGSGEFPEAGFGKSAYIHNIVYEDTAGTDQIYDGSAQIVTSDTTRYNLNTFWNSGETWGSYFYLGGPGAGGVIGG